MKIHATKHLSVITAGCFLAACSPVTGSKQGDGTIIGGIAGGTVGSLLTQRAGVGGQIAGTVGGAILGGLIGGAIGAQLDEQDRQQLARMELVTGSTGRSQSYVSPRTKVAIQTRTISRAKPLMRTSLIGQQVSETCSTNERILRAPDGTTERKQFTVCKGADGSWKLS